MSATPALAPKITNTLKGARSFLRLFPSGTLLMLQRTPEGRVLCTDKYRILEVPADALPHLEAGLNSELSTWNATVYRGKSATITEGPCPDLEAFLSKPAESTPLEVLGTVEGSDATEGGILTVLCGGTKDAIALVNTSYLEAFGPNVTFYPLTTEGRVSDGFYSTPVKVRDASGEAVGFIMPVRASVTQADDALDLKKAARKSAPKKAAPVAVVEPAPVAVVGSKPVARAPKKAARKSAPKKAAPVAVVGSKPVARAPKKAARKSAPKKAAPVAVVEPAARPEALTAYLDRLLHKPKKDYATDYAASVLDGSPVPAEPSADWAPGVRARVDRFSQL